MVVCLLRDDVTKAMDHIGRYFWRVCVSATHTIFRIELQFRNVNTRSEYAIPYYRVP